MALAALIAAYHESTEPGVPLRALLPLAGRTLVERQARLAASVGARPVILFVEAMPPELAEAVDRLRRDRLEIVVVRRAAEVAEAVDPDDSVLLVADGFVGDAARFAQAASAGVPALLTVPDGAFDDRFERIDARSRWAGLALVSGALVEETAAMLQDWDFQSTLLRRAVQARARLMRAAGDVAMAEREADLTLLQRRIFDNADSSGTGWASKFLLAPLERIATRALMGSPAGSRTIGAAAVALTAAAAFAFAWGWLWTGLLLLLAATPLDGTAERLAQLRMEERTDESWWCHLLPILGAGALVALGYAVSAERGWGAILLSVVTLVFLLAQRFEGGGTGLRGRLFLAGRKNMSWLMLPFALAGSWIAGIAALFAYAAGSFFWVQNEVHSAKSAAGQD